MTWALGESLVLWSNRHADGNPMLSVEDLRRRFTGGHTSMLEMQVRGPMRKYLDDAEEAATLISWIRQGASAEVYQRDVAALVDERCVRCHRGDGEAAFRPLTSYAQVKAAVDDAPAPSFRTQLLVTKVHVVGIGLLLAVTAFLFLSVPGPELLVRLATPLIAGAFVGLALDFGSWWLMRLELGFAWGRMLGNAAMSASFLLMCASVVVGATRRGKGEKDEG